MSQMNRFLTRADANREEGYDYCIVITKKLWDVIDEEDKEILEDMIMLAIKDAFSKIDKETENKLGQYSSMSGLF